MRSTRNFESIEGIFEWRVAYRTRKIGPILLSIVYADLFLSSYFPMIHVSSTYEGRLAITKKKKKKIIDRIYVRYVSAVQHFRFGELNSGWKIGGVTEQMAEPGWMSLNKSLAPEHRSFSPPFISTLQFFFSSLLQSRIRIQFSILASMDLYKKN